MGEGGGRERSLPPDHESFHSKVGLFRFCFASPPFLRGGGVSVCVC